MVKKLGQSYLFHLVLFKPPMNKTTMLTGAGGLRECKSKILKFLGRPRRLL